MFFVLAVSMPGWFIQMRMLEKLGRLERRVGELESRLDAGAEEEASPASE